MSDGAPRELSGWGRHPVVSGVEIVSEDLEAATAGRHALARAGPLVRRRVAAGAPGRGRRGHPPRGPAARLRPRDRRAARRGRLLAARAEPPVHAARLHLAGLARHPVRDARRRGRLRRPRQATTTSPARFGEHVREPAHAGRRRARARGLRARASPSCSAPRWAAWDSPGTSSRWSCGSSGSRAPWIYQEARRVDDLDALVETLLEASRRWPLTKCWFDSTKRGKAMGRGFALVGRWAEPGEAPAAAARAARAPRRALRPAARAGERAHGAASSTRSCSTRGGAGRRPASCTRRRSSGRSTACATGTGCTGRAASRSTSACCRSSATRAWCAASSRS